eukprot:9954755-Alexandrium_andersonii.AAC.1
MRPMPQALASSSRAGPRLCHEAMFKDRAESVARAPVCTRWKPRCGACAAAQCRTRARAARAPP